MLYVQLYYINCMILIVYIIKHNFIPYHLASITHNVELVIEGGIENDEYISNAMEAIEKYCNVSLLMYLFLYIIVNYFK